MKKGFKIFLIQFLIMSGYIWGIEIYGAIIKEFDPVGGAFGILFLALTQTIITFLICLFFIFKTEGDLTAFKSLGINILSIAISFIIYFESEQLWFRIHTFFSKT